MISKAQDDARRRLVFYGLALIVLAYLARLVLTATLPYADTTEARYGAIAQFMAASGDWITPWFDPQTPFWGKPPLSFWTQAISFKILGVSEFAGRLPSWLATMGILGLTFVMARAVLPTTADQPNKPAYTGVFAVVVLGTMAMTFISAGSVMTDSFLALGVTLSITSLILCLSGNMRGWRWGFFIGLSIGLLAKGPIALVLVGFPIVIWTLVTRKLGTIYSALPWFRGTALVAAISLPWYVIAELKTPGFLDYFIVGEHFRRFLVPGWEGDLYGSAHDEIRGTIWLHLLSTGFPWIPIALATLAWRVGLNKPSLPAMTGAIPGIKLLLLTAGLTPAIFFTFSGNILPAYNLPGLPFLAILIAVVYSSSLQKAGVRYLMMAIMAITPIIAISAGTWFSWHHDQLKTEGPAINTLASEYGISAAEITFVGDPPFSARFYGKEAVKSISASQLITAEGSSTEDLFSGAIAISKDSRLLNDLPQSAEPIYRNLRYVYFRGSALNPNPTQ